MRVNIPFKTGCTQCMTKFEDVYDLYIVYFFVVLKIFKLCYFVLSGEKQKWFSLVFYMTTYFLVN